MDDEVPTTTLELALAWPTRVAREVLLAPWTIQRVRRSLGVLPDELEALRTTLNDTTQVLEETLGPLDGRLENVAGGVNRLDAAVTTLSGDLMGLLGELERLLPELSGMVNGMDGRVERVELVVSQLSDTLLAVAGGIPGVRRAVRGARALPSDSTPT